MNFFFFNDTGTTEIYPLSLHDALPICTSAFATAFAINPPKYATGGSGVPLIRLRIPCSRRNVTLKASAVNVVVITDMPAIPGDRKSTRLNSSHANISYAVFCLKKKKYK